MPLREELRSNGEWLFRWRSYLPLVLFALVFPAMVVSRQGTAQESWLAWDLFCVAVGLMGEAVRVLTVGFVPRGTSGRNTHGQVAEALNTTGMYSLVRHPLYLGNFLMWMGPALLPANGWLATTVVLAFWLYYERIMFAEEEFLRGSYGELYDYLRRLEGLPSQLYWSRAELTVTDHPLITLKLTVHTISFDRAWLVV